MRNEKLYNETVDIILDAYNERKLVHGCPCGCFIGNIVAKKYETKKAIFERDDIAHTFSYSPDWFKIVKPEWGGSMSYPVVSVEEGLKQIQATGYTLEEIVQLEQAFESMYRDEEFIDGTRGQFEGMKAALEVLAEIHETEPEVSLEKLQTIHEKAYA